MSANDSEVTAEEGRAGGGADGDATVGADAQGHDFAAVPLEGDAGKWMVFDPVPGENDKFGLCRGG